MKQMQWCLSVVLTVFITFGAWAEDILITPSADDQEAIQEALILAEPGQTIRFAAGTYRLTDGLSLDVEGVTLVGAGEGETILSFKGQETGGEGLLITSHNVTVRDLGIEDTKGDALKAKGVDGLYLINMRVEWTNGPDENNGAYGIYPVQSQNILIDGVIAKGASDAGIYVGQSQHIIVRNSLAQYNVAGIEIENSYYADVYNNEASHNTGGILVFDLPNLQQMGGHSVRVFENKVVNNDTLNFAPEGNIVGLVPTGTGVMIMANRDVEIFNNIIEGNGTASILIGAYPDEFEDEDYDHIPRRVAIYGNKISNGGFAPEGIYGDLLKDVHGSVPLPDIIWDGVTPLSEFFFGQAEEDKLKIDQPGATFLNANLIPYFTLRFLHWTETDMSEYEGRTAPLSPVKVRGVES